MNRKAVMGGLFIGIVLGLLIVRPPVQNTVSLAADVSSTPAACAVHFEINQVSETSAGVIGYSCVRVDYSDLTGHVGTANETASSPAACASHNWLTRVIESALGILTLACTQSSYSDISGHVGTANETASAPAACAAGNKLSQVTESAAGALTLTCVQDVNQVFASNANTCADTTSGGTGKMAGFSITYTTQGASYLHTLRVTLNWKITAPTTVTVNTQYQFSYGTGTAPICGASKTGTQVGNTYEFLNPVAATTAAQIQPALTVVVTGLSANTAYWFDVLVIDSSTASWTYSLPQLSVSEN